MKLAQKISAILVLSLFILSVIPVALADEGKDTVDVDTKVNAEARLDSDVADAEVKTESKTKVESDDNDSEAKDNHSSQKQGKSMKREFKPAQQAFEHARERLEQAKEHFEQAKEEQHKQREKVLELNKQVKRCNSEKKDCTELKTELRLGVKNHLAKSVNVVQRSLEKLTSTVDKMEDLPADEKEHALSMISDLQNKLDAQKATIDTFTANTTQEEIRAAIKDLKDLNQEVHKLQRRLVGLLVEAKLNVLVEKHAELHDQMQARIDALAAEGKDVSKLKEILAEFDAKVEVLKQDYEAAKQQWMKADSAADFDQFNRDLREAQHTVREDLQETKQILRKFLAEYRQINHQENNETEDQKGANQSDDSNEAESNTSVETNASANATVQG